jgi:hypothetical protein
VLSSDILIVNEMVTQVGSAFVGAKYLETFPLTIKDKSLTDEKRMTRQSENLRGNKRHGLMGCSKDEQTGRKREGGHS